MRLERLIFLNAILFCHYNAYCFIDLDLMFNFLEQNHVRKATIFTCINNKTGYINYAKALMNKKTFVNVLDLKKVQDVSFLASKYAQIGIILDGDCENVAQFLIQCGKNELFAAKYHWLVWSSSIKKITETLKKTLLNIDANIQIIVPERIEGIGKLFKMYDIYNPASHRGGNLRINDLGFYKESAILFNNNNNRSVYFSRKDLSDVIFKSIVVLPEPYEGSADEYLKSDLNREVNTFNRFHHRLVTYCQEFYNFSLDLKVDKSWGYKNPDGTFDGMVGSLERKLIDFGSSCLFVREDRGRVIDYGRNTWILRSAFIMRNPKAGSAIELFLKPFSASIWLCTIACASLIIVIFKFIIRVEAVEKFEQMDRTWSSLVLFAVSAFSQQGSLKIKENFYGKTITISVYILSMIVYQFYTASLVSHLLTVRSPTINSVEDIVKSSLKAGCQEILYARDYLKYTTDKWSRMLNQKKIYQSNNKSNYLSPQEGLKLVQEGNYAFNVETATAYPIIEKQFPEEIICELIEVQMLRTQPMHANYQKHSSFKDMMDYCFQRLAENGVIFRERIFWHPRKPNCVASSITFSIGLDEFYPALLPVVLGTFCSLIILLFEKCVYSRKIKKRERKSLIRVYPFTD